MTEEIETRSSVRWHFAKWSLLAWLETIVKTIAILFAIVALVNALSSGIFQLPSGVRLAQSIVLGILSLGLVAAIFDRFSRHEIVSMIFVIFNNLGHWGMLIAFTFIPGPAALLVCFSALMLVGDLVKLASFKLDNFTQSGVSLTILYLRSDQFLCHRVHHTNGV